MLMELPESELDEQTDDYERWMTEAEEHTPDFVDMSALAPVFEMPYRVKFSSLVVGFYVTVPAGVAETEGERIANIFNALKGPITGCKKPHVRFSLLVRLSPQKIEKVPLTATLRQDDDETCLIVSLPEEVEL